MASLHKTAKSPYWYAAFYLPDGRRAFRSTGTTNKRQAWNICLKFEEAARLAKQDRLTEARARETIADIFAISNQDTLPTATTRQYLEGWMQKKRLEVSENSLPSYQTAVDEFIKHLGAKASKLLDAITARDVVDFRSKLAARLAGATVNKYLKLLRGAWTQALRDGLVRENIFIRVNLVKEHRKQRRAFTLGELNKILAACNHEWRGMVLTGLYTGQRLSDVANLTWAQVDLAQGEIRFTTRKTDRNMVIPIAKPLMNYLLTLPASDSLKTPLFPTAHGTPSNTLSHIFTDILDDIGLVRKPETHEGTGKGRDTKREVGGLSFHCLRHTATSLLKNAGVSDVIAREIIGHDSETVSRLYTHIESDTLRQAIERLPDVTKK